MRSHYCGEVTEAAIDKSVQVCGWVHRRRDHGGVGIPTLREEHRRQPLGEGVVGVTLGLIAQLL